MQKITDGMYKISFIVVPAINHNHNYTIEIATMLSMDTDYSRSEGRVD
jgi:hypothetical protein